MNDQSGQSDKSDHSDPSAPRFLVRVIDDAEMDDFLAVDSHAFGSTAPDALIEEYRELIELDRTIAAFDGATMAGIATAFSFGLTVPGATVPAAGVSAVGVMPTHRRQGVLRALMTHQLHDVHDTGREPVAVLWASEPPIYGRFGYGLASRAFTLTVPRDAQALGRDAPDEPGLRLRVVPTDDWKVTQQVYEAVARQRPGMLSRDERWWRREVRDLPDLREGRSALRAVVVEDDEQVRGYVRYSTKPDWSSGTPRGTVHVREVMAVDPAARAALYRYLFDLDLMGSTELWNTPVDDPLLFWLQNLRTTSPRWQDALYVRLVDLPAALARRTYATALDVVIEVHDALCPWNEGRWRLVTGAAARAEARCERTDRAPDLTMGVRALGAAYLGGTSLAELALAGQVEEQTAGSLAMASAAFRHSPAPWCPIVF